MFGKYSRLNVNISSQKTGCMHNAYERQRRGILFQDVSSFQKSGVLFQCVRTITLHWGALLLFPITRNCYLISWCHSDIQLHRGSTGKDENEECNNTQAYFRGIRGRVLAWNLNPYYNIILFGCISRSTVHTEWLSPSSELSKRQTSSFLLGYRDVLLFYRLFVAGGSGLFSMTNPAINSSCDIPYLITLCCSCTEIKP